MNQAGHFQKTVEAINWESIYDETIMLFREYLKLDTTNPPGNEKIAADFFKEILAKENIQSETLCQKPGRGNLIATVKGNGKKRPLLLVNHMDVVPVENFDDWDVMPFSGIEKDGFIWGRGALDMKSFGIIQLMTVLIIARHGIELPRDLTLVATADEETGGAYGIGFVLEQSKRVSEAEYALNEGGGIRLLGANQIPCYSICVSEKFSLRIRITTFGAGGHGSIYSKDNPILKLMAVLQKIENMTESYRLTPVVSRYFKEIAEAEDIPLKDKYKNIENSLLDPEFEKEFRLNGYHNAMVRNTKVITVLDAGEKLNVVPTRANACLDCRLLPGTSADRFMNDISNLLCNDNVKIEILESGIESPVSPIDTPFYDAISKVAKRNDPGCIVAPYMMTGGSDSSYLRRKNIITYGFAPFRLTPGEKQRVHGKNERISIENIRFGIRALLDIVLELNSTD